MKLHLKKLGHIENAVIEDADLVVIVGDNGSGKTLLLESVALVKQAFEMNKKTIVDNVFKSVKKNSEIVTDIKKIGKELESLILNDDNQGITFNFEIKPNAEEEINEALHKEITKLINTSKQMIKERVLLDDDSIVELELLDIPKFKEETHLCSVYSFYVTDSIFITNNLDAKKQLADIFDIINLRKFIKEDMANIVDITPGDTVYRNFLNYDKLSEKFCDSLIKIFIQEILATYFFNTHTLFLPSERNTYIQNAIPKIVEQDNRSLGMRYSEHLFVKEYLNFTSAIKNYSILSNIPNEYNLLFDGTPTFNEDGEVESIVQDDKVIKKVLFSTKMNRMVPYLIINNPLKNYNTLIVEEPEAHMSLKSMTDLVNFFKYLLERKSLFITTHSDVFFTKINNLLLKNPDTSVKIYELVLENRKSNLKEIIKNEYGYKIELFSNELEELFNETIELQNGD
ncbi:AAA family ATPase [Lysinibacillus capsici]|uniref:AAA family ATPase n=1 Tax=Lysinibacillus capsici TaxID=2115968 RepID=UPI002E219197|nr:hypothetical protein [Lysinibacillus capsici]